MPDKYEEVFNELPPEAFEQKSGPVAVPEENSGEESTPDNNEPGASKQGPVAPVYNWMSGVLIILIIVSLSFSALNSSQTSLNESDRRISLGNASIIDGDLDGALYHFIKALEENPNATGAHSALGRIALSRGRGSDAASHFNAELKINPDDYDSHLAMGCLNVLGVIENNDPHRVKDYLVSRFVDVLPYSWSHSLNYESPEGTDALSQGIYHFQAALEIHPDDPSPLIGLVLVHIANYDLETARQKLARLTTTITDELALAVLRNLMEDINTEELRVASDYNQYPTIETPGGPDSAADWSGQVNSGIDEALSALPPMGNGEITDWGVVEPSAGDIPGFGSPVMHPSGDAGDDQGGLEITPGMLGLNPTVKPINQDVRVPETNELIKTIRIANVSLPGNVGYREGETIIMPNSNAEITILESSENRIVIQEGDHTFIWIPADVGWQLDPSAGFSDELNITVLNPEPGAPADTSSEEDLLGPEIEADTQTNSDN